MHNCFHADLELPFLFDFVPKETNNKNIDLGAESMFVQWLSSLNLEVLRGGAEQFYIPPGGKIPIHSDGKTFNNKVKINFQFGGAGSKMRWYIPRTPQIKLNPTISRVNYQSIVDKENVTQVWEAEIKFPSLVNTGVLHNVVNGPEPRWVIAVPLWDLDSDSRLQWDDAVIKFQPWIVKESSNA